MTVVVPSPTSHTQASPAIDRGLARVGRWLATHRGTIAALQWGVVAVYWFLLVVPVLLPLPDHTRHVWTDLTLFAQFVFWGIWWPFVLVSMVLVGRLWCGVLCPEGALSEKASRFGLGRAVPRWVTWKGWPFVAFVMTTVYGQLVSVYQYPAPALVVLGGSTVAAIAVGLTFGRGKRVWCRHLCPVNGVFGLLSKLAPFHYRVDANVWAASPKPSQRKAIDCAPLVAVKTMRGASECHMCGRCEGFRGAVTLARRSPSHEIVHVAGANPKPWETWLIVVGLMGVAAGAFHWTGTRTFIAVKQAIAEWAIEAGHVDLLEKALPWWVLTNYPARNDVMTVVDGAALVAFIAGTAVAVAVPVFGCLAVATRMLGAWSWARFHHLAQALVPIAAIGVFLGLSALTVTMLKADDIRLPWVAELRASLILGAAAWSLRLAWGISGVAGRGERGVGVGGEDTGAVGRVREGAVAPGLVRRLAATTATAGAIAVGAWVWASLFWKM